MRVPDRLIALFLLLVSVAVYLPSIEGEFLYDDLTQIEANQFIQRPEYFRKALTSEVFAFRSDSHLSGGAYWRPGFMMWLIANYQLFGTEPAGWHFTNLLVNGLAVILAYYMVRRLGGSQTLAACAALLFALHPAHVESVAWISGVTDPLLAVFYFGTLLLVLRLREKPGLGLWAAALGVYAGALSMKEPAILFPLLVMMAVRQRWGSETEGQERWGSAIRFAMPFAGVAAIYFCCRFLALQGPSLYSPGMSPLGAAARNFVTAPSAIVFYLREVLLPFWIAPAHPFRPLSPWKAGWTDFAIPLAGLLFVGLILERVLSRNRLANFGACLFFLSLIPALNVAGLGLENVAHDRYLYIPLLGMVILGLCAVETAIRKAAANEAIVSRGMLALTAVVACVLGVLTVNGQDTWSSGEKLWDAAVAGDPSATWVLLERSSFHLRQGRLEEARRDAELAYLKTPFSPEGIMQRADVAIAQARYEDAIGDLRFFVARLPESASARTMLGAALQRAGRYDEAIAVFREGREKIPVRYCSFTQKMAIVMADAGRTAEAIRELEAVRPRLGTDHNAESRLGLRALAHLYRQTGRTSEALDVEREFLRTSEGIAIPAILAARSEISGAL